MNNNTGICLTVRRWKIDRKFRSESRHLSPDRLGDPQTVKHSSRHNVTNNSTKEKILPDIYKFSSKGNSQKRMA